ncbi:hypothetical protein FVE85_0201 [Porphyridium purpureum]|uniref:Uncharacterized protein n=1 Tax=Porphyridium purpureum TaxID=35688 RepID=A0A5J4Z083_PORPP|nr:hypothetical protein FVE85_0201 [Porphyridium purpureum]|eukprot:POR7737..scf208_2
MPGDSWLLALLIFLSGYSLAGFPLDVKIHEWQLLAQPAMVAEAVLCGSEAWLLHSLNKTLLQRYKLRMVLVAGLPPDVLVVRDAVLVVRDAVLSVLEEPHGRALAVCEQQQRIQDALRVAKEKQLVHVTLVEKKQRQEEARPDLVAMQVQMLAKGSSVLPYADDDQLARYVRMFHVPSPGLKVSGAASSGAHGDEKRHETTPRQRRDKFLAYAPSVSSKLSAQVMDAHSLRGIGAMSEDELRIHHSSGLGRESAKKIVTFMNEDFSYLND